MCLCVYGKIFLYIYIWHLRKEFCQIYWILSFRYIWASQHEYSQVNTGHPQVEYMLSHMSTPNYILCNRLKVFHIFPKQYKKNRLNGKSFDDPCELNESVLRCWRCSNWSMNSTYLLPTHLLPKHIYKRKAVSKAIWKHKSHELFNRIMIRE